MRFGTSIMEFDLVFSADNGTCKFCCVVALWDGVEEYIGVRCTMYYISMYLHAYTI